MSNTPSPHERQLIRTLKHRFPLLFPTAYDRLVPWAIGAAASLRRTLEAEGYPIPDDLWRRSLRAWFHARPRRRAAYLAKLLPGVPRYAPDGSRAGVVTAAEARQAWAQLHKLAHSQRSSSQ